MHHNNVLFKYPSVYERVHTNIFTVREMNCHLKNDIRTTVVPTKHFFFLFFFLLQKSKKTGCGYYVPLNEWMNEMKRTNKQTNKIYIFIWNKARANTQKKKTTTTQSKQLNWVCKSSRHDDAVATDAWIIMMIKRSQESHYKYSL